MNIGLNEIMEKKGLTPIELDEKQLPFIMPVLLRIQKEGATFFIKMDGEREHKVFTIMIEGGLLKKDYIRIETDDIWSGVNKVFGEYALRFWF